MQSFRTRVWRLKMTMRQFHGMPRHPSYRYEYFDGTTHVSPRIRSQTLLLKLGPARCNDVEPPMDVDIRPLAPSDWRSLPPLFCAAFGDHPPYCDIPRTKALAAAEEAMRQTRQGHHGVLVPGASFVARDLKIGAVGLVMVTLVHITKHRMRSKNNDPDQIPVAPHLTWVGIAPMFQRQGIASRLLGHVVAALRSHGHRRLYSTILDGNLASMYWHWRNGFQLQGRWTFGSPATTMKGRQQGASA